MIGVEGYEGGEIGITSWAVCGELSSDLPPLDSSSPSPPHQRRRDSASEEPQAARVEVTWHCLAPRSLYPSVQEQPRALGKVEGLRISS